MIAIVLIIEVVAVLFQAIKIFKMKKYHKTIPMDAIDDLEWTCRRQLELIGSSEGDITTP